MIRIQFPHGLGDCTYFAHQLPLYARRGYDMSVICRPDKSILFQASGVDVVHEFGQEPAVGWLHGVGLDRVTRENLWAANKAAVNLGLPPMPSIGTPGELWKELCEVRLNLRPFIPSDDWAAVLEFLDPLPRPIVLLHTKGNSFQSSKSLPDSVAADLCLELLDKMPGTVILLDWDQRVPKLANYRVRHLVDDWEWIQVPRLMALLYEADLMMGVDSGPLHACRFTDTPAIGMFPSRDHYPVLYCLPRDLQVNIVPHDACHQWNKQARIAFNITECPGSQLTADFLARTAASILAGPRYLSFEQIGADVQLQQFILDWERGYPNPLSGCVDRHRSYDRLFKEMRVRFRNPVMVETGCIRSEEDWRGAGFSTYLFAVMAHRVGGHLHSFDNNPEHVEFARKTTLEMNSVSFQCGDSVEQLSSFGRPIDILLLDSLDSFVSNSAEHALNETKAALPWLHPRSLILFDDTVYFAKRFHGKGSSAVPWLLEHGWSILYSGYQTLLTHSTPSGSH